MAFRYPSQVLKGGILVESCVFCFFFSFLLERFAFLKFTSLAQPPVQSSSASERFAVMR